MRVAPCCGTDRPTALVVTDATLGDLREIVSDSAALFEPAWSPDGGRLAYTRQRDGDLAVWGVEADGERAHRITRAGRPGERAYGNASASWKPAP